MKRITVIIFFLFSLPVVAQERYALLIGIGRYPVESGWAQIHGNNDVEIIRDLLVRQGFKKENITALTNESATKIAIITALDMLKQNVSHGDIVYIHFSGHGQQITDLDGDEDDHYDEAWIPFDAKKHYASGIYEGENHIIDDELNIYLTGLRAVVGPLGRIVLISDACHSGSGSRGVGSFDDEEFVRGTSEKFIIPNPGANVVRKELPVNWLYVGACKSFQTNHEYKSANGTFYGSLSYVIASADIDLANSHYRDVVSLWRLRLDDIARYPQDLDEEGSPSKRSNFMF